MQPVSKFCYATPLPPEMTELADRNAEKIRQIVEQKMRHDRLAEIADVLGIETDARFIEDWTQWANRPRGFTAYINPDDWKGRNPLE